MNYNKLKVFYEVAKKRNQSRAARELYISQSTLSKHILDIEAYFNTQLFQRTNRDLVLTNAGETLYQICNEIFSREDEIYRRVWEAAAQNIDTLRIATMRVSIVQHLPELHRKFNDAYPGINLKLVRMNWSDVLHSVEAGETDIGIKPATDEAYPKHISHYSIKSTKSGAVAPDTITPHTNSRQIMTQDFLCSAVAEDAANLSVGKGDNAAEGKKDKSEMSTVRVRGNNMDILWRSDHKNAAILLFVDMVASLDREAQSYK